MIYLKKYNCCYEAVEEKVLKPDMWEFRGFAEFRGNPRVPGCSWDLCKFKEKMSDYIGGVGCSVAPQTQLGSTL